MNWKLFLCESFEKTNLSRPDFSDSEIVIWWLTCLTNFYKWVHLLLKKASFRLPKENLFCPNNASEIYIFISWGHQSTRNTRINHLHERALRIVYNDNESTFEDLLKRDNSVSINHKNIRLLGIELYKVKNNLSTHLMSEIFNLRNIDYNLRS